MKDEIACGSKNKDLECKGNKILKIAAANCGKTNKDNCKENNEEKIKNCYSDKNLEDVKEKCDGMKSCEIKANNCAFGEPCKGRHKYLNVTYDCVQKDDEDEITPTVPPLTCATISTTSMATSAKISSSSPTDGGSKTKATSTRFGKNSTSLTTYNQPTDLPSSNAGNSDGDIPIGVYIGVVACVISASSLVLYLWFYKQRNRRKSTTKKNAPTKTKSESNAPNESREYYDVGEQFRSVDFKKPASKEPEGNIYFNVNGFANPDFREMESRSVLEDSCHANTNHRPSAAKRSMDYEFADAFQNGDLPVEAKIEVSNVLYDLQDGSEDLHDSQSPLEVANVLYGPSMNSESE